jgi:predicted dehydrogenase
VARNLALIGCGAIAQNFYLPAIAKHRALFGSVWFVDPADRTRSSAASIVPGNKAALLADVDDDIQLAIIATPNSLHFPIAYEALSRGADVLIEKPFVICPSEGRRLVEAAAGKSRVIAINQTRRLFPIARAIRQQIEAGDFGPLMSIVHREGTKLLWPFESGAGFARSAQRTGVIMDFGVHVIDFYHYVLEPKWKFVSAIHDGFDGPEGLAEVELEANGSPVSIRLSRYYKQDNIARMKFERVEVSFNVYDATTYLVNSASGRTEAVPIRPVNRNDQTTAERLLLNFLAASERREPPVCDPASSMPVIDILDEIYRSAGRYPATPGYV